MSHTGGPSVAVGDGRRVGTRVAVLAAATAGLAFVLVTALTVLSGASLGAGDVQPAEAPGGAVSALATAEIPPLYLRLYQLAARRYGLSWAVLAGIGKVECDHGRDPDPSCTQEGAVNSAGAGGPMQFIASTWARFGVDAEGNGPPDRWNAPDAIYAAANFLRASGAPESYSRALFAYNHASWYVAEVESWARKYSAAAFAQAAAAEGGRPEGADTALVGESPTPVLFVPGEQAELAPGDGHLALVPAGVPATVQAMVVAGNELQDLPYGPDGHPDPLGASQEDCSSTVNYVLYRAGVRPLEEIVGGNPLAQDYVNWGAPGPGRWVTIYATDSPTPHVFMLVAGLRLDTSHDGTDVGPNRYEDGPRWRIFDQIPAWAHWSVRHPPGL
ncbi:MAG TPA: lytic transglycosylase domain-containing protein [Solirubrobacteraceae bacterium]|nr:lytic transglycosylase domain-containing protein [Solirubrobacteraceae bacterium]